MQAERRRWRIGNLFELVPGFAFKSSDFTDVGCPVIKIKNVKAGHMVFDDLDFVDPSFVFAKPDKVARHGDILITMSGNRFDGTKETWVGKVAQFRRTDPFLVNQRVGILRPKRGVQLDLRTCTYLLSSDDLQQLFIAIATSSGGQANLSPSQILGAEIVLPGLKRQGQISRFVGALDDKIELNRRMNETLEAIARAIFKSWFVDFDPVRAKAEGRQPPGLSADIAALFPSKLNTATPVGWRTGKLGEVIENKRAQMRPGDADAETPYIGLEHMPRKCIALSDWGRADQVASNKFAFSRGDILFGKLRPYFHKVGVATVNGVCSTDVLVINAKSANWFGYALGHLSSDDLIAYTDAASTGTKMPRTSWTDLAKYQVVIPTADVAGTFNGIVSPIIEKIRNNIHESRTLMSIRDTLLPNLLSGQIRIQTAKAVAESLA